MLCTKTKCRIVVPILCAGFAGTFSGAAVAAIFSTPPVALSTVFNPSTQLVGNSMALSANGQVAAVGAPGSSTVPSAVYVYAKINGVWGKPISLPISASAPAGNVCGAYVAISANGQTILVGCPSDKAYAYTYSNGAWGSAVPLSVSGVPGGELGNAVALSPDGTQALVGGNSGTDVYAYTYNNGAWGTPVALSLTGIPANTVLNGAIAMASNGAGGLVAVIGANNNVVYAYTNSGSGWGNPVALPVTGIPSGSGLGQAIALSANGQVAIVGAPGANSNVGATYVYTYSSGTWSNPLALATPASVTSSGGAAVALSANGQIAFASGYTANSGIVSVYANISGSWSAPVVLSTSGVVFGADLGSALAVTADGEELLAGAEEANGNQGMVYDYQSPANVTLAVTPTPSPVAPGKTLTLNLGFSNNDTPGGGLPAVTLSNVVLTDTLPVGVAYVSSNAANGSCSSSGNTVTCTLTSLAAGTNSQNPWQPSITVTTPSASGVLTNTVSASANEPLTGTASVSTQVINDVTPSVTNGGVATTPGTAVSGTLAATPGYSGQKLTFVIVSQPSHGTVTLTNASTGAFTYTPAPGFSGTDAFAFYVGDGTVTSGTGVETLTVTSNPSSPPVANNQSLTDYENQPLGGQLTGSSPNGHALTYTETSQPAHGSVTVTSSTGAFTYTPASGYTGNDSFTFTANDGTGTSNTATVNITVSSIPSPTGAPVAGNENLNDYAGQTLSGTLVAVSPSGKTLTYAVATQPAHGNVTVTASTGAFSYTPASGFTGSDSFTFAASDGTNTSNTATVAITVLATPAGSAASGGSSTGKSGGGTFGLLGLGLLGSIFLGRRRRKSVRSQRRAICRG